MPAIPYIKKKIGHLYLVWFQNSNLYIQLEEPAWFVFSKLAARYKASTIAKQFSTRYNIPAEKSLAFVRDIQTEVQKLNTPYQSPNKLDQYSETINKYRFTPFSTRYYKPGKQVIAFTFESQLLESWIHPLISHFETTEAGDDMPLFELFAYQGRIAFRFNGETKGVWGKDETQFVKGLIFMFLVNVMHDKSDDDWLMTVHASAITNGQKTILFSAEPGKGKTTFAALLQAHGYHLISDDFVPIDRHSFNAYPFPIAISVKPGSMELLSPLFPELEQRPVTHLSAQKVVRYISPSNHREVLNAIFPVRVFIFIEYNRLVDFKLEKLDPVTALKSLLDQVWVTPVQGNAQILLDQIMQVSFYKLTYSNNPKAMEAVTNLFDHD
ncbi:MAG: hypothetical protein Q8908_10110 [Bacteroidota bacterium]|nr:hypothetical protein [Bacteroidota bacterium]